MGGTVAVTLKEPDGTEHRMYRWTNSLPWFVNNIHFINKKKSHIRDYLKQWNDMKEDWEKNKSVYLDHYQLKRDTENAWKLFKFPMTPVYAPFPAFLVPTGYGLVVIDMQNNVILSCQGYTTFGHINLAGIVTSLDTEYGKDEDPDHIRAKNLFDANKATVMEYVKVKTLLKKKYRLVPTDLTYEQMIEKIMKYKKDPSKKENRSFITGQINLDLSPFIVQYFDKCSEMLGDIKKLGFQITAEEEKLWQEWIKEMEVEL